MGENRRAKIENVALDNQRADPSPHTFISEMSRSNATYIYFGNDDIDLEKKRADPSPRTFILLCKQHHDVERKYYCCMRAGRKKERGV